MGKVDMSLQQRANPAHRTRSPSLARRSWLAAPALVGAWISADPAAAGQFTDWLNSLTGWDAFDDLESPLAGAYRELLASSEALHAIDDALMTPTGAIAIGLAAAGLLAGFFFAQVRRGRGELSLHLEFPDAIDGEFDIRLRPGKDTSFALRRRAPRTRTGVRRETQFDRVPAGRWILVIDGMLRAKESGSTLARVEEEVAVEIKADACTQIDHPLPPVQAPIEFRIHWDRQPARDVGLGLKDRADTVRYANTGIIKTRLPLGQHEIMIGTGDRIVERPCEITSYEPSIHRIDLAAPEGLVFKGCPPAVSPFLQGDLANAARALARDRQPDIASLLLARLHSRQGQVEQAAEALESAGRSSEAAVLRREISDFDRAAALFENAGDLRSAAPMYAAAEDWTEAARAYAELEDWTEAARCFERSGDIDGLVGALEGQGEIFRAAALATEHGDRARSIRLLQQIGPMDETFGRAGELLALAYEQEGHVDLAANQLERCLDALPPGEHAPQLELHLSELLDESGEVERALDVLEALRHRDPTYPGVAPLIEHLRKKVSGPQRDRSGAFLGAPAGATTFVAAERYEVIEEIGRGGMGLVYKARDRRLGRSVALKRMPENLRDHPGAVQLFLGEAQAAARMNHPNIVTLFDADQENGSFFITMELLEGLPLNTILKQRTRFGPRDSARLGTQVCAGLQYAHDQGIVHRDIKTANLFVTREHVLKIMDFGLAKILEAVRDQSATLIAGTPFYMAPEQGTGNAADGRMDLYAFGVTLFELSTGQLPFIEGDVALLHRTAERPDPRELIPDYPEALALLVKQLMAIDPGARPDSPAAVQQALMRIINER